MSDIPNQEDPGLDRHVWESEWESLQEELADRPAETLPALVEIVADMLRSEGYAIDDPVASEGDEREVLDDFREARRIATIVSEGGDVDPGDVGAAVEGITAVYQTLIGNAE
jgi:hypothetical protein